MKYGQRNSPWASIKMGFGTGNIYDFGCYLTSLASGLSEKGHNFDPQTLNQLLIDIGAWVGPSRNYIDATNLSKYLPDIFVGFKQIEPWNDIPSLSELLRPGIIVVCKVSAAPIGGTGTHFVLLTGQENGVAKIWDPWSKVEELITKRWSKYGNIQGLRIFEVKVSSSIIDTMEKLPKDNVLKDIRTALCGTFSQNEIDADLASNKNLVEIITGICDGDEKFYNKWIKSEMILPTATVTETSPDTSSASTEDSSGTVSTWPTNTTLNLFQKIGKWFDNFWDHAKTK